MQVQPKADDVRASEKRRARQAAALAEDAFRGGTGPSFRLTLKAPWLMLGAGRLWPSRRSGSSDRD